MQLSISSDTFINFVFYSGLLVVFITVVMMLFVVIFRLWSVGKTYEIKRFYKKWSPLFKHINHKIPPFLPPIRKKEYFLFLKLWSDAYERADDNGKQNLLELATHLKLITFLMKMFDYDNGDYTMLAMRAAGYLKDHSVEPRLIPLIKHPSPIISLIAAQTMIRIAPKTALDFLVPLFIQREEWLANKILLILKEVDVSLLTPALLHAVDDTPETTLPKLIKLFNLIEPDKAYEASRKLLFKHSDPEIIAACMHYVHRLEDKPLLLQYLHHEAWVVRMHALKALINILLPEDLNKIIGLLSDESWWVRYHAARVLVNQKFVKNDYLEQLESTLFDNFAKDAIRQARDRRNLF